MVERLSALKPCEKETIRPSRNPTVVEAAKSIAETTKEQTVCIDDFDMFVTMM